jgi:hypothetical protein
MARVERFAANPIIVPDMDERIGTNINGPSLVRAPSWVEQPLGRYYLYFAHHIGDYIRLAFAEAIGGPWTIYQPGALQLRDSCFPTEASARLENTGAGGQTETEAHIASPDVHVDEQRREVRMYYHGLQADGKQVTRVAVSSDGLSFQGRPEVLGLSYFRVFGHGGWHYAVAMPGVFYRSKDGLSGFEQGPFLFHRDVRHFAVEVRGDVLDLYYTVAFEAPERIYRSQIALEGPWDGWKPSPPEVILEPEAPYEGADLPLVASARGAAPGRVRQLRDPAVFVDDDGSAYLLYAVAGESGIAIARLAERE